MNKDICFKFDRKNSKMCRKICVAIQDYLEYNYPESDIDSSSWIYYIAEKLGISQMQVSRRLKKALAAMYEIITNSDKYER